MKTYLFFILMSFWALLIIDAQTNEQVVSSNSIKKHTLDNLGTNNVQINNNTKMRGSSFIIEGSLYNIKKSKISSKDLKTLVDNLYYSYWLSTHSLNIHVTALVAADQFTASWKNFGWYYVGSEPRIPWDNTDTADNDNVTNNLYFDCYNNIAITNSILNSILIDKINIESSTNLNTQALALCYFIQGVTFGNLGLVFDKAMIIKENTDTTKLEFSKHPDVVKAGIESLEKAISICDTASFELNSSIVNKTTLTNILLKKICHSYIARFLVQTPRTSKENSNVNWSIVLEHANQGITQDFGPVGDSTSSMGGKWYDDAFYYLTNTKNSSFAYAFVDCRLIHLMDSLYPANFPQDGKSPKVHLELRDGEAQSVDKRLKSDFKYFSDCGMYPERGYYHFSNYQYTRYDYIRTNGAGQLFDFRQYENDLYKAEAYAMIGGDENLKSAITILNDPNSPRILRGAMNLLVNTSKKQDIIDAIFYEREIELLGQGFMLGFCDMRRRDLLQYGTPLHYPIPVKVLDSLKLDNYTFGGIAFADGINTSNKGWNGNNVGLSNELKELIQLNVFPNPANNLLHINNINQNCIINIYNVNGINIFEKQLNNNELNISFLPKGLYIIKATYSDSVQFAKFYKE